ncbi:uncharacterized protein BXZ73DRAFT_103942 [Epithele typhae]|uniref:uncharacterized protein n=1 Tax=Epithele typhae TaxID=378194 RepID=UPI002007B2C8|nr:uncharacterized protein BXZ73DRAFT_103942 [Epithele typhae]KAH9923145.1 hypothetical protein BXZ73DRAFT_103942 [Epithele typhae]
MTSLHRLYLTAHENEDDDTHSSTLRLGSALLSLPSLHHVDLTGVGSLIRLLKQTTAPLSHLSIDYLPQSIFPIYNLPFFTPASAQSLTELSLTHFPQRIGLTTGLQFLNVQTLRLRIYKNDYIHLAFYAQTFPNIRRLFFRKELIPSYLRYERAENASVRDWVRIDEVHVSPYDACQLGLCAQVGKLVLSVSGPSATESWIGMHFIGNVLARARPRSVEMHIIHENNATKSELRAAFGSPGEWESVSDLHLHLEFEMGVDAALSSVDNLVDTVSRLQIAVFDLQIGTTSAFARTCKALHPHGIRLLLDWNEDGILISTIPSIQSFVAFLGTDSVRRCGLVKNLRISMPVFVSTPEALLEALAALASDMTTLERLTLVVSGFARDPPSHPPIIQLCRSLLILPTLKHLTLVACPPQFRILKHMTAQLSTLVLLPMGSFLDPTHTYRLAQIAPASATTLTSLTLKHIPLSIDPQTDVPFTRLTTLTVTLNVPPSRRAPPLYAHAFPALRILTLFWYRPSQDLGTVRVSLYDAYRLGLRARTGGSSCACRDRTTATCQLVVEREACANGDALREAFAEAGHWSSVRELSLKLNFHMTLEWAKNLTDVLLAVPLATLKLEIWSVLVEVEDQIEEVFNQLSPEHVGKRIIESHEDLKHIDVTVGVAVLSTNEDEGEKWDIVTREYTNVRNILEVRSLEQNFAIFYLTSLAVGY